MSEDEAEGIVKRSYKKILHRDPDAAGLRSWARVLAQDGKDQEWLENVLRESEERKSMKEGATRTIFAS